MWKLRAIRLTLLLSLILHPVLSSDAHLPPTLLQMQHSPSPYECAVLSAHAYRDDVEAEDPVRLTHGQQPPHVLHGWKVFKILREASDSPLSKAFTQLGLPYGYRGIMYLNEQKKQLVLAHRGTQLTNVSAIKTDVKAIVQNVVGGQERIIPQLLEEALTAAKKQQCSLTVTGHSLGGWLAQITVFIAQIQYPELHVKAIAFDSPGAQPMLAQINPRINPINLDRLDVTSYLSTPNLINACNAHIGTVYRVVFEKLSRKRSLYTMQSHAMATMLRAFDPQTGDAYRALAVRSWPLINPKSLQLAEEVLSGNQYKALMALFELIKRCANQEILGEFSGFFKFAKRVNRYHPQPYQKQGKDAFELTYKYHYHTTPHTPTKLHIRHFPKPARQFLKNLNKGSKAHIQVVKKHAQLQTVVYNERTGWVDTLGEEDLRLVCDWLLSTVQKQQELAKPTGTYILPCPSLVSFFVDREAEAQTILQCFKKNQDRIIAPPITGPGGIGKTQLALKVVQQRLAETQYDHVFWIPAESEKRLVDAYLHIAVGLGIYVDDHNAKQTVRNVRFHLKAKQCLYVFDDAPDIATLHHFLPLGQGHVLVTSRNGAIGAWQHPPVQLNALSEADAIRLASRSLFSISQHPAAQEARRKIRPELPRKPLILTHFVSILQEQGSSPTEMLEALQKYAPQQRDKALIKMLAADPQQRLGYDKGKSALYIFETSLQQLAQARQGQAALQLLSKLAHLDSHSIPVQWLLTWDTADKSLLHSRTRALLALLEQHSMIRWNRSKKTVQLHEEVQKMVRHFYPQPHLSELIDKLVGYVSDEADFDAAKTISLLPHARALAQQLGATQHSEELYKLSRYLIRACGASSLFREGHSWAQAQLRRLQRHHPHQAHPQVAQALSDLGRSLCGLGHYGKALHHYKQALAMWQQLYAPADHLSTAIALNCVGYALTKLDHHKEAMTYIEKALAMKSRLHDGKDHVETARSLNFLGYAMRSLGHFRQALAHHQKALAMRQRLCKVQDHPRIADSLHSTAISMRDTGSYAQAIAYFQQAAAMYQRLYKSRNHPKVAMLLNSLGKALRQLGRYDEALAYTQRALAMGRRLYPDHDHDIVAVSLAYSANVLGKLGHYDEALAHSKEELQIKQRLFGERDHSSIATAMSHVGRDLGALGHYDEALRYLKQALAMIRRIYPDQAHPRTARILYYTGQVLQRSGAYAEALARGQEALSMQKIIYQTQAHSHTAATLHGLGEASEALGQYAQAIAYYKQALSIAYQICPKEHPNIARYRNSIVTLLHQKVQDPALVQTTLAELRTLCAQYEEQP